MRRQVLTLVNMKKKICQLVDFADPADYRVKTNEKD